MSWCQQDPTILMSSAKDNRTICWDVHTTDILCELPTSNNWNFDVQVRRQQCPGIACMALSFTALVAGVMLTVCCSMLKLCC